MTCGIYKLNFKGTDKVYIGQSQSIEQRYNQHLGFLKRNLNSKKLQKAYEEFGVPEVEILIECDVEELDDLENNAIEIYNSFNDGFNTQEKAGDIPRLVGEEHPGSKYSNEQILYAFLLLCEHDLTHEGISKETGVSKNMVNHIAAGTCHMWLAKIYPDKYHKLISSKPIAGDSKARGKTYPKVISPDGNIYDISNLRSFSREHSIPYSSLNGLVNNRTNSVRGWKLYNV